MGALVQFPKDRIVRSPELDATLTAPSALEAQRDKVADLLVKRARAKGKEVSHTETRRALDSTRTHSPLCPEEAEDLARVVLKRSVRNGIPDTIEDARERVHVGLAAMEGWFRAKLKSRETRHE